MRRLFFTYRFDRAAIRAALTLPVCYHEPGDRDALIRMVFLGRPLRQDYADVQNLLDRAGLWREAAALAGNPSISDVWEPAPSALCSVNKKSVRVSGLEWLPRVELLAFAIRADCTDRLGLSLEQATRELEDLAPRPKRLPPPRVSGNVVVWRLRRAGGAS